LQAVTIPTADQQAMMGRIDQGGEKLEAVISEWMDANEETWKSWVAAGS
jgi:ABC-type proline/glycine betaine transport system substrate-binding protein